MVDPREFRFEFPCPKCQGKLRLRDRALIGTKWTCPECRAPLEIRDTGQGGLAAVLAEPVVALPPAQTPLGRLRTVAILILIAAITGTAVLVFKAPPADVPAEPVTPVATVPPPPADRPPGEAPQPAPPAVESAETQLTAIGQWLKQQHDRHGAFPVGVDPGNLPLSERFGWSARYVEETDPEHKTSPDRSRSWRDQANDAFVRRRAAKLLNTAVTSPASPDGFPAGHYVGVAGVGNDAPALAKSHPRAGIFGNDRRTTRDDIRDGVSNTFLVLGVDSEPAAWASGAGAVRGVTGEPYLHGPDHFGTGQVDGMHVLLADGSVKFLSAQTDPKLFRRLAAMADGLPLDPSVPGEPADPSTPPVDPVAGSPRDPPITVEITPEVPPQPPGYDFEKNLAVPLTRFRTPQPVSLKLLLRQITEMSALPIDLRGVKDHTVLDQTVTLDLKNTTIRGVLEECLKTAGLQFEADRQGIRVLSSPAATEPEEPREPVQPRE